MKSYLRMLPWPDQHSYLQGQAYWILDNVDLFKMTGNREHAESAVGCAEVVASRQTQESCVSHSFGLRAARRRFVFGNCGQICPIRIRSLHTCRR